MTQENQPEQRYLAKKEVAYRLGISVRSLDSWMRQGKVPFFKIGRSVAFRWSDIENFFDRNFRVCRKESQ